MASSLQRFKVNAGRFVTEARMLHSATAKLTLVVEGEADFRFFRQWLAEESARLEKVDGKDRVIDIWHEARKRRFENLVCLTDLDYDQIVGNTPIKDDRFVYISLAPDEPNAFVECNDLESALVRSKAFEKLLAQRLRGTPLYEQFEVAVRSLRDLLRTAATEVGAFRAADQAYVRGRRIAPIGDFDISAETGWFDASEVKVSRERLEAALRRSSRAGSTAIDAVCRHADELATKYSDGWQLCRGHDLTTMLAMHLTAISNRRIPVQEVERELRLSFEGTMLKDTQFGARMLKLQESLGRIIIRV
jgi:hypothetical protein